MKIVAKSKLMKRAKKLGGNVPSQAAAWYHEVKGENWERSADVMKRFPNADIVNGNFVVFNIDGNKFRLVVNVNYETKRVFVKFLDTHAAYDREKVGSLRDAKI